MQVLFLPSVKIIKAVTLSTSIPHSQYLAKRRNKVRETFSCHAELVSASHIYKRDPENDPSTEFILSEAEGLRTGFGRTVKNDVFLEIIKPNTGLFRNRNLLLKMP